MRLGVFTTVYPGVEPYLRDWQLSVRQQTDTDFDLWVASDGLRKDQITNLIGDDLATDIIAVEADCTPATVRNRVLSRMTSTYDAIVLVDADDVLHADRIEAARRTIQNADFAACGLRIVDKTGNPIGRTFACIQTSDAVHVLPRTNAFGFSNSVYRSATLAATLPVPAGTVLVDWLVATRAWLAGATPGSDPTPRMDYRRHGRNAVHAEAAHTPGTVRADTAQALEHLRLVKSWHSGGVPQRRALFDTYCHDVTLFARNVLPVPERLAAYTAELNQLAVPEVWWHAPANARLSHHWLS